VKNEPRACQTGRPPERSGLDPAAQDSDMCAIEDGISRLSTFGSVLALVAAAALLAWIIGLLIVLRGSEPDERSEIIHAYAHCNPLVYLRRNTAPRSEGSALARARDGTADSGDETDHEGSA
jgi:hypothetical protein